MCQHRIFTVARLPVSVSMHVCRGYLAAIAATLLGLGWSAAFVATSWTSAGLQRLFNSEYLKQVCSNSEPNQPVESRMPVEWMQLLPPAHALSCHREGSAVLNPNVLLKNHAFLNRCLMSVCRCLGPAELGEGFCGVVSLGGDNRDCFSLPAVCLGGASPSASVRSMAAAAACRRRAAGCLRWPDAAAVGAPAGPSFPAASLPGVPRAAVAAGAALLSWAAVAAGAGSSSPAASPLRVALPSSRSLPSPSSSNSKSMSETSAVSSSTSSYMSRLTCTQSNTGGDHSLMLGRG